MRIVEINTCNYGSTGKIMLQIAKTANQNDHKCWIAIPKGRHNKNSDYKDTIWIGNQFAEDFHIMMGRITGLQGCCSIIATRCFLKEIEKIRPDIIHIHNLHNSYINIPMLFNYIKKNNIKVVWTLHDCWAFTGHCPHFLVSKCNKWEKGCNKCPSYKEYPRSCVDHSKWMWKWKKKWFSGVKNMTIVTPSKWLAELVEKSFLREYPVKVINNGIDLKSFRPVPGYFKKKKGITDQKIILGVAFDWGYRKGLDIFCKLAENIGEEYKIVLVGTNEELDKSLPQNIISIHKTQNQQELAEIYSDADVFFNPTREDNYPTVNMEAIACGTPVLTFNTGGSPESILNDSCGSVINTEDICKIREAIDSIIKNKKVDCNKFAVAFNMDKKNLEYIRLYEEML